MRLPALFALSTLLPLGVSAAAPEKFYFVGEAKLSGPDGKAMGSNVILLEKIHDADRSTISERAVVVKPGSKAEEQTMVLTVKGDSTFTLADTGGTVKGAGTLFGPAWKWTYFKGTFRHASGVVIEDENFMADESVITARKKIRGPDGKVLMFMDMSLKSTTPRAFEILTAALKAQ
jgi:hypothetical protein